MIPVAAYPINVCKFTGRKLKELDQEINRELRSKNMLGKKSSNETLYLRREEGGRGIKSLKDIYKQARLRVASTLPVQKTSGSALHGEERTSKRRTLE